MRYLVTGTTASGESTVVAELRLDGLALPTGETIPRSSTAYRATLPFSSPPQSRAVLRDRPSGRNVGPGDVEWIVNQFPPPARPDNANIHRTNTVDFVCVLSGSTDLVLDDGNYPLTAGDGVVLTGIDHGWRMGPEGCTHLVLMVGTPEAVR